MVADGVSFPSLLASNKGTACGKGGKRMPQGIIGLVVVVIIIIVVLLVLGVI